MSAYTSSTRLLSGSYSCGSICLSSGCKSTSSSQSYIGQTCLSKNVNCFSGATDISIAIYFCRAKNSQTGENVFAFAQKYRRSAITTAMFNEVYGLKIEQIKTTFTMFAVVCNFLAVRYHDHLSLYILHFMANGLIFAHTLPPLLYYEAYKVHENSGMSKKIMTRALARVMDRQCRLLQYKEIKSLRPLQVRVAGIYFLDRMMAPLYLRIILSYTCTVLLSR